MSLRRLTAALGSLVVVAGLGGVPAQAARAQQATLTISTDSNAGAVRDNLMGANHRFSGLAYGAWDDVTDAPRPEAVAAVRQAGLKMIRYPGGTVANTFHWKRALGTLDQRKKACQTDGRSLGATDSVYGPIQHMRFVQQVGAEAQMMVASATITPDNAADWVEFMNAKVGANPNGGYDWALKRKELGYEQPFGVRHWELGNEHYHLNQRYWMSTNADTALNQYINGGKSRQQAEALGKRCAHPAAGTRADGSAGEVFEVKYPPIAKATAEVKVNGVAWRRVENFNGSAAGARHFVVDAVDGHIRFGDGRRGSRLPVGARVTASYDSVHQGFSAFAKAMKAVDKTIKVCSSWSGPGRPAWFVEKMGSKPYDCVTAHPYTHFDSEGRSGWRTALDGHDQHMLSPGGRDKVKQLRAAVRAKRPGAYVAISESGALWGPPGGPGAAFPGWDHSMTHATYMASQLARWLEDDIEYVLQNDLFTWPGPNGGGRYGLFWGPGPVRTAEAVTRDVVKPLFHARGRRLTRTLAGNPVRTVNAAAGLPGGKYEALVTAATRGADGRLYVMVVNRLPQGAVSTQVKLTGGFVPKPIAQVRATKSGGFTSLNNEQISDGVTMTTAQIQIARGGFGYTFPAHSVTLFQLDPA